MRNLSGKVVLITGAASGIGKQMALRIAEHGAHLVLWDLNESGMAQVAQQVEASPGGAKAHCYVCDVSDRAQVYAVAERVKAEVGAPDVLINNAGVVSGKPFLDLPDDKIEKTFAVNTLALFWTAKAFLPDMVRRNSGHVVTVASSAGLVGVARLTDYCASKWAAVGFDESLRMELKHTAPAVKTTVVCPFFIDTGMFEGARTRFPRLLPILKESQVADRIVKAILTDQPSVILPPLVGVVPVARALPVAAFDAIAEVLGINRAMDHFIGRKREQPTQ